MKEFKAIIVNGTRTFVGEVVGADTVESITYTNEHGVELYSVNYSDGTGDLYLSENVEGVEE